MYYYDEPDLDDIYGDSANAQIDEEMETLDECFKEWAHDYDHVPEDATEDDYALASTDPATPTTPIIARVKPPKQPAKPDCLANNNPLNITPMK